MLARSGPDWQFKYFNRWYLIPGSNYLQKVYVLYFTTFRICSQEVWLKKLWVKNTTLHNIFEKTINNFEARKNVCVRKQTLLQTILAVKNDESGISCHNVNQRTFFTQIVFFQGSLSSQTLNIVDYSILSIRFYYNTEFSKNDLFRYFHKISSHLCMKTVMEKFDDSINSVKYLIYFLSIKLATTSRLFDPKYKVMSELLDQHSFSPPQRRST